MARFHFDYNGKIDVETAVELLSAGRGMLFYTSEGRKSFFERAKEDLNSVGYGCALSHARGTKLGVWGSSRLLYQDCSLIMMYELRRRQQEIGVGYDSGRSRLDLLLSDGSASLFDLECRDEFDSSLKSRGVISQEQVAGSYIFSQAYEIVREPDNAAIHNLVRALGSNAQRMDRRDVGKAVKDVGRLSEAVHSERHPLLLHDAILEEIGQNYRGRSRFDE